MTKICFTPQKKNIAYKIAIYIFFVSIIFFIRLPFGYISDDAVVAPTVTTQTIWENFMQRWLYNGRIFTDVLANMFYRIPMIYWKLFDTLVYVIMATLISKIFTKNTWFDLLMTCGLILLFPINCLNSAGYIATTTNYVYPVLCMLFVAYHLNLCVKKKHIPIVLYIVTFVSILYATNHDQGAVFLIGALFLFLIYALCTHMNQKVIFTTIVLLGFAFCCYVFMFMMPGHLFRMTNTAEMYHWFPQYAEWSFAKKIYHGFSTTIANLLFTNVKLFFVLCVLIFLQAMSQDSVYKKIISAIPLAVITFANFFGESKFVVYYDYSCGMPDLIPISISILPLILSVTAVCSIFYTVCSCVKQKESKFMLLGLLVLSAITRELMGLSATIYASSFRTFTFFLYAIIICCLILMKDLYDKNNKSNWCVGIGAIFAMFLL
ncbi:MAG: hypothetical protein IJE46_02750 [Clostridia bacterium]|nr:hypothetical protein [Clostridia bacterium]